MNDKSLEAKIRSARDKRDELLAIRIDAEEAFEEASDNHRHAQEELDRLEDEEADGDYEEDES